MKYKVPFSAESTNDGYWEIYHDDDCGALVVDRVCTKCKFFVDLQSLGARPTEKNSQIMIINKCNQCGDVIEETYKHQCPWDRPNIYGELPGGICCQRSLGGRCYEHSPHSYLHTHSDYDIFSVEERRIKNNESPRRADI